MSASPRKRVAVLLSGRGSNMAALLEAAKDPAYPAEIVAVLSNRPDAGGLDTARAAGIEAVAIDHKLFPSRAAHEAAVAAELTRIAPDIVCLAGYMRLLGQDFTDAFRGRMINIHPSLLPLFPGLHTHERVLAAGMRIHGCTVHFVTEVMDEGPIIAQAAIAVLPGDTPDGLAARLIRAEHRLYAEALRLVALGRASMAEGRAVLAAPETPSGPGDILLASDEGRVVAL
jgi:phosphoribosylglycinamide formyltransferase 1